MLVQNMATLAISAIPLIDKKNQWWNEKWMVKKVFDLHPSGQNDMN